MSGEKDTAEGQRARALFEPSEFYEKLLGEREADPARFERSYSAQTKRALELYEEAKAKATRAVR